MTNGPLIVDGILANVPQEDSIAEHNIPPKKLGFIMWGGWSAISSPIINRRALGCCRNIWHIVLPTEATLCKKKRSKFKMSRWTQNSLSCQDDDETLPKAQQMEPLRWVLKLKQQLAW